MLKVGFKQFNTPPLVGYLPVCMNAEICLGYKPL